MFHSGRAELVRARERGRRVGGTLAHVKPKKLLLPESAPDVELREPADILSLLSTTISQTRKGTLDLRIAQCIGSLCAVARSSMPTDSVSTDVEFIIHQPSGKIPCGHCAERGATDPSCLECGGSGFLTETLSTGDAVS
jgi:hypothetical protein